MAWSYDITTNYGAHYRYKDNALIVYNFLTANGYSHAAAIGVLANMEHESYINPGQVEHGYGGITSRGYGLVQWTPANTKILAYAKQVGGNWYDGDLQLQYLLVSVPASWIATKAYPQSYAQYLTLDNIYTATRAFFWNFERGTYTTAMDTYALYWHNYIESVKPEPTPTPTPTPTPPEPPYSDDDAVPILLYLLKLWH